MISGSGAIFESFRRVAVQCKKRAVQNWGRVSISGLHLWRIFRDVSTRGVARELAEKLMYRAGIDLCSELSICQ